jgi:hypothetical protein
MERHPGERAIWNRREKGGRRRVVKIEVEVMNRTPVGNYTVRYTRDHGSTVIAVVQPSSLEDVA